jgi:hypothetical protein
MQTIVKLKWTNNRNRSANKPHICLIKKTIFSPSAGTKQLLATGAGVAK